MAKSKASVVSKPEIERWINLLGLENVPATRKGLREALAFFQKFLPTLSHKGLTHYLKAMDLGATVRELKLGPPLELTAFRHCLADSSKVCFTPMGSRVLPIGPRSEGPVFSKYRLVAATVVLESRCQAAPDSWTDERRYFFGTNGA